MARSRTRQAGRVRALTSSMNQWNNTSKLVYQMSLGSTQWWNFNLDNLDFSYWGYDVVPGLTQFKGRDNPGSGYKWNPHNRADVRLNSNFTWNTTGVMDQSQGIVDVRTIATHEIGHATGLAHPADCGPPLTNAEQFGVMFVDWTKKWVTRPDDDDGNKQLYGVP